MVKHKLDGSTVGARGAKKAKSADTSKNKPGRPRKNAAASAKSPGKTAEPSGPSTGSKRKSAPPMSREMDALVRDKRRAIQVGADPNASTSASGLDGMAELEKQLADLDKCIAECKGVEGILKAKVLRGRRAKVQAQMDAAKTAKASMSDQAMHEQMAMIERLEKANEQAAPPKVAGQQKVIPLANRLFPAKPSQKNLLDIMAARDADRWTNLRAHKKRYAIMYDKEHPKSRANHIDACPDCAVDFVVDREMATAVCPNCGYTRQFASHIFDTKDAEKDDNATRQQSLNHMQKFSSQFERGHPSAPLEVLESLSVAYGNVHLHDPSKVQACRTSMMLKGLPDVPKSFKRAPDRLTKELKAEGIPEFTGHQILHLLNQRNRLRVPDDLVTEAMAMEAANGGGGEEKEPAGNTATVGNKKARKSFNNQIFVRHLGRSDNMEQSRLFPNPKTARIHLERTRALEKECMALEGKALEGKALCETKGSSTSDPPARSAWVLYPAS